MRLFAQSSAALACILVARSAAPAADPSPAPGRQRLGADLGLGSALGGIGIGYQLAPVPWARVEAGLGYGATGTQLSLMPKVALGGAGCRYVAGLGASLAVGNHIASAGHQPSPSTIPWINVDAFGLECRSPGGFSWQAALGVTVPLVAFHYDIADVGATLKAGTPLPQGRVGLGWWF